MNAENKWVAWARELQFLSQCALEYCKDVYNIERFQRIREISAEMMSDITDAPVEQIRDLFCGEKGYQTPKLSTRAAIIEGGKILLVQESGGLWALPGGWVDYNLSIRENAVKEVREEAGLVVRATRLVALLDHNRNNTPKCPYETCSVFVLCEAVSGHFEPNNETIASGYFSLDALPPLAEGKNNAEQIEMCFRAQADPRWAVRFD